MSSEDEETGTRRGRLTDLSKAMLPLPVVWVLIGTSLAAAGGVWAVFGQVNILSERQEAAKELSSVHMKNLNDSMGRVTARQELQQYEIQQLKDTVQELKTLINERNKR